VVSSLQIFWLKLYTYVISSPSVLHDTPIPASLIWSGVQIMKLIVRSFPPASCFSLWLHNILFSILFSGTFSLYCSLRMRDEVSHPYTTTGRIIVLYTITFRYLGRRWKDYLVLIVCSVEWTNSTPGGYRVVCKTGCLYLPRIMQAMS
jgi:hypothetical protein